MFEEAVASYEMAKDFSEKYLGEIDSMTIQMKKIYEKAKSEIEDKKAQARQ